MNDLFILLSIVIVIVTVIVVMVPYDRLSSKKTLFAIMGITILIVSPVLFLLASKYNCEDGDVALLVHKVVNILNGPVFLTSYLVSTSFLLAGVLSFMRKKPIEYYLFWSAAIFVSTLILWFSINIATTTCGLEMPPDEVYITFPN